MNSFLKELYEYNQLVNDKIIHAIMQDTDPVPKRTLEIGAHMLLAHQTWNMRMQGEVGLKQVWQEVPVEEWSSLNLKNTITSLDILAQKDISETFKYTNTRGEPFSNTYKDVLFHVINHSSYHRGQINADLRRAGIEPVVTDYIFYRR